MRLSSPIVCVQRSCQPWTAGSLMDYHQRLTADPFLGHQPYQYVLEPWEAVEVFRHTIEPNVFAWNTLIAGLVHGHYFSDPVGFYHEINVSHVRGDKFTYPCVLKACTNLQDPWEGNKVHAGLFKGGLNLDAFISASLIDFYLKFDAPDYARQLFDKMTKKNSVNSGYAQRGVSDDGRRNRTQQPDSRDSLSLRNKRGTLKEAERFIVMFVVVCNSLDRYVWEMQEHGRG
ncbi:hypothetical protein EJ110_NYTH58431 [Nymphaea thermarum]|nr:hypothetical protein EJ110_NYTH58431 [Nymphaea thermarum]